MPTRPTQRQYLLGQYVMSYTPVSREYDVPEEEITTLEYAQRSACSEIFQEGQSHITCSCVLLGAGACNSAFLGE